MTRAEFEALWNEEKSIVADIRFRYTPAYGNVYQLEDVEVYCESCMGMTVHMSYDCDAAGLVCNFTIPGLGAIHRYCINGTVHGSAGRFHEHFIQGPDCVRQGLKNVVSRDDLREKTVRELWNLICKEAKITCTGEFHAPEELC